MTTPYDVAELQVIRYENLLSGDEVERSQLLRACIDWGFFYLDLGREGQGKEYLNTVQDVLAFSKRYFDKPLQEKLRDTHEDFGIFNICGYKPMGLDHGNAQLKKDGCEGLRIPIDLCYGLSDNPKLSVPPGAQNDWPLLSTFARSSHDLSLQILSSLSDALGLDGPSRFETHHRSDRSSKTTSVLQHYPHTDDLHAAENISSGHFTHTDTGSITILFNTEWGLQVHSPDSKTWKWIPPHPDFAIVNIGDTLKFMSNLTFKSALHRVVPASEKWVRGSRYAAIFFARAGNEAEFVDLEGKEWKAGDWLNRKFGNYRETHAVQASTPMSTGELGFLGLWEEGGAGIRAA